MQAQSARAGKKVTIIANNTPLREILMSVTQQTGFEFVYLNEDINEHEKVTGRFINQEIDEFLAKLFSGKGLSISYRGNAITIRKKSDRPVVNTSTPPGDSSTIGTFSVSGRITDGNGNALPGATIMVKGARRGVSADDQGQFAFAAIPKNATLTVSLIGYEPKEVILTGNAYVSVKLKPVIGDLDEAIVVAYGTTSKSKNTGAVTVVKGSTIRDMPNQSFDRSLQGQVPGLLVTTGNGQPGGGVSNFVLRGIGTGTSAAGGSTVRQPLIVVDGVPLTDAGFINFRISDGANPISNPLSQINTADIESISVLKDASAIALYGSKASNGVILITTKKGKVGDAKINFSSRVDIASPVTHKNSVLTTDEYLGLLYESYKNSNPTQWTDEAIDKDLKAKFPTVTNNQGQTAFYEPQDWFDGLYKSPVATTSNNLSLSGGSDKSTYYLNLEVTNQNGVVKNSSFDRYSLRYNMTNQARNWLKVGLNSTFSYTKQDYPTFDDNVQTPTGFAYVAPPLDPIRLSTGKYYLQPFYHPAVKYFNNPVAQLDYNKYNIKAYRTIGNLFAEAMLNKNLRVRTDVGGDVMFSFNNEKLDPRFYISSMPPGIGQITSYNLLRTRVINTNSITYQQLFNEHSVSVLVAQESQLEYQRNQLAIRQGIPSVDLDDLSAATTLIDGSGVSNKVTLMSYFGQLNYSYKNKLNATVSARRDGSSKFGPNNRYGNYWSTGAGWVVSNEHFMNRLSKVINLLKLRASVGTAGNSATILNTTRYDLLQFATDNGVTYATLNDVAGNRDIKWEKVFNKDVGLEFSLFDRLNGTVDLYERSISDLLYAVNLYATSGYNSVIDNIGKMSNKGIEVGLSVDVIKSKDFSWRLAGNWSTNKNKLVKANQALAVNGKLIDKEGENYNSFYLVRWAGVNPDNGKPTWYDISGKVTETYSLNDRVIVGKPQPDGFGSLSTTIDYKRFQLSSLAVYQYGFQVFDVSGVTLLNDGVTFSYINQSKKALDRWQKPGDIAMNPRRVLNNVDGGNRNSTRYLYDGDFIRLKNISLSYAFGEQLLSKLKVRQLRVYANAYNVALWTKYKGLDPENVGALGDGNASYPQSRSYSLGLDLTF
ncbi:TonB-dependent receptor [Chitinophaga filiformis]|uniref:TonB-dependent receptor n=1 Tax=Chitinophaga filiformis TaxID=104663 RepID=A0ABY4HWZ8_CHIFI|nr:TonB-dependent receptor [Chitinophaga filiformis]UPK68067.1 TonB-dependent receptor [Chitinophaga filiformis]